MDFVCVPGTVSGNVRDCIYDEDNGEKDFLGHLANEDGWYFWPNKGMPLTADNLEKIAATMRTLQASD